MGVKVNRIEKEFVLKKMVEKEIIIKILSKHKEIDGKIIRFCDEFLIIDCPEIKLSHLHEHCEISIFFMFENNQHTFSSKILEIKDTELTIAQPELTYKNLQRQYERIKSAEDIRIFLDIKGKRIQIDFPKTRDYFSLSEPTYTEDFNPSDIQNLIRSFRKKMEELVSVNKIIMLRNTNPSTYEEKLMAHTGKIIWIPYIDEGFLLKNPFPEVSLLTYQEIADYELGMGTLRGEIGNKFKILLKEKKDKGFYSQLYCPLLYTHYLVGYIYLCNTSEKKIGITIHTLKYVNEFSKVLCYSLKTNHYFNSQDLGNNSYSTPVIDISASGLLFAHTEKYLSVELPLHAEIMITLKIGKRKIETGSTVIRKYMDKNRYYFALKFTRITREDFRFLYEFIYGKKYSVEAETIWENTKTWEDVSFFIDDSGH
ncbi:MAG: PilZ domain-containing protein [Spirochaetales bacterium]|nr:PilZ domain-containing protein [Spirochaetales bacterium]